ncbi:MAG TPA: hypothetical protein VF271_06460 [Rhodanobacteraceae bacterium]
MNHPTLRCTLTILPLLVLNACSTPAPKTSPSAVAPPTSPTGVAACDAYLASYKATHLAAGTFPPATLDAHYQGMRKILLDAAHDPRVRPYLAARCTLLARSIKAAAQGH